MSLVSSTVSMHRDTVSFFFLLAIASSFACGLCALRLVKNSNVITCNLCKSAYHKSCSLIFTQTLLNCTSWTCMACASTLFPFNHIIDEHEFISALGEGSLMKYLNLNELEKLNLDIFSDELETRALLNNPDLDPDTNYFKYRPTDCTYLTPSDLGEKFASIPGQLSFLHLNCRSIINKISEITMLLNLLPVDLLAITESWLNHSNSDQVCIPGYSFVGECRQTGRGGGVGFFIKSHIKFEIMSLPSTLPSHSSYECLLLRFPQPNGSYYITGVVYRPPGQDLVQFNLEFGQLIAFLTKKNNDILILGDFNIDLLKSQNHLLTSEFLDTLSSYNFLPLITKPTRITSTTSTLIDNIFTNSIFKISYSAIVVSDISDHLPIIAWADLTTTSKHHSFTTSTRHINENSISYFKTLLSSTDWTPVYTLSDPHDPNIAYDIFLSLFKAAYDIAFPIVTNINKPRNKFKNPWMSAGLLKSCRTKEKLYLNYIKKPNETTRNKFTKYRNKFKSLRIQAERNYYQTMFSKYNHDLRKTWRVIRSMIHTNKKDEEIDFLKIEGIKVEDPYLLAEHFNSYFTGVAKSLIEKIPHSNESFNAYLISPRPNSFAIIPTSPSEIINVCRSLKTTHSSGLDGIDPTIMNSVIELISTPLTHIINNSFSTGIVPTALKSAKVVPIFKQGSTEELSNYRPISILPCFSKLLEKIMYNRLYDYVIKMKILFPFQHGFQAGHSTSMSLLTIQDNISNVIDKKEFSIGVFLDVAKAFDTIDHDILLAKLENMGIRGLNLDWFRSYLLDRNQLVICRGKASKLKTIKYGVPQGSILGPLLFLLFINDLPNSSSLVNFILFADDSNLFLSHKSYDTLFKLANTELQKVTAWFKSNKLSLNVTKTNFIVFCSHRKHIPSQKGKILINDNPIPQVSSVKFLGIHLDQHLTWNNHISEIAKKLSKNVGILYRIAHLLPTSVRINIYYSLIHPFLSYCNVVWASNYTNRLKRLIILQKKAIRIIAGKSSRAHSHSLFQHFKILQLEKIKITQMTEFIFKYKMNLLPTCFENYFNLTSSYHKYELRSADKFRSIPARTNTRMFSIKCSGPRYWNSLPLNIRSINNFRLFKQSLRSHLLSQIL